jgi:hypothetical protein
MMKNPAMPDSVRMPDSSLNPPPSSRPCPTCHADRAELRNRVAQLANENMRLHAELRAAHETMQTHKATTSRIVAAKCDEEWRGVVETSETALNLHAASARLHEGVAAHDVLLAIQEIVINLIGSEEVAVFEVTPQGELAMVSSFGVESRPLGRIPADDGVFGRVVRTGSAYVRGDGDRAPIEQPDLTACVPLKLCGRVVGVVAIFKLLAHKDGLRGTDRELLELVSSQAAPALWGARAFEARA